LKNSRIIFEDKLLILQDKEFVACWEIFSEGARSAYELEVFASGLGYEVSMMDGMGKNEL